jgi:hypothetical protein
MSDASNMYPNYNTVLDQSLTTSPLPINILQVSGYEITEKRKKRKRAVQPKVGGQPTSFKEMSEAIDAKLKSKTEVAKMKAETAKG